MSVAPRLSEFCRTSPRISKPASMRDAAHAPRTPPTHVPQDPQAPQRHDRRRRELRQAEHEGAHNHDRVEDVHRG